MTDFSSSNNISMNLPHSFQGKREDLHKSPDFLRPALVHEHNISYQELKNEYVKALNYIEILQLENKNLLNTMKTVSSRRPDLNSASTNSRSLTSSKSSSQLKGVIMSQPMTDKKYIQLDQENRELKRLIAETKKPLRDLEDEKKIIALEREVDDLRKTLEEKSERIAFMQKEGRFHQERIVETYQLERENKQLKSEIQYLNDELDSSKRKYKQLEEKNSTLVANDPNSSPLAQETNQNLMKSSGQLLSTINTFSASHFVRTCFEERFSGAVEVHRLLNTKDYANLLLKNYKYINDLLFNINTPSMPTVTNIAPLSARGQNTDRLNESSLNRSGIRTQQQNSPTHKRKPSAGNERPNTPGSNLNVSIASNANNISRSRVNIQPQPISLNNSSINHSVLTNKEKPSPISNNNSSILTNKEKPTPTPISNNNTPSVRGYHSRALSQNIPQTNTGETVLYETNSALNPKPQNQRLTFEELGTPYDSVTMFDASKSSPAIHNQDRLRLKNLLSTSQPRDFRMECNNELKDRKTKIADVSSPAAGRSSLNNDSLTEKERLLRERERHLNEMERELKERDRELREKSREISEKRNNTSHNMSSSTPHNNHSSTKDYMTFQKDTPSNYNSNQNTSKPSNESRNKSTPTPQLHIPLNQTVEHNHVQDNRDFIDSRYEDSTSKHHENDKSLRFTPIAHETSGVHRQVEEDYYKRDYTRGGSIGGESVKGESVRIETGERFETRGLGDLPSTARDYKRRDDLDGSPLRRMHSRNKSTSIPHFEQQQQQQKSVPETAETRMTGKLNYTRDSRVQPWELQERDYQPTIGTARELRYHDDDDDEVYQNQNRSRNQPHPQPQVERNDDYHNVRRREIESFSPNSASNAGGFTNRNYEEDQETEHIADQTQNNHITFENQDDDEQEGYDLPQYGNNEYNEYSSRNGYDNSKSYSSRQRGTASPTDYPTFRVAFGRTESKARFSSNQDPNGSVLDLQKKKRVGHLHSTYDVIRGEEARFEAKETGDRLRYEFSPTKVLNRAASTHNVHLQNLGSPAHSNSTSITPSARHMEH